MPHISNISIIYLVSYLFILVQISRIILICRLKSNCFLLCNINTSKTHCMQTRRHREINKFNLQHWVPTGPFEYAEAFSSRFRPSMFAVASKSRDRNKKIGRHHPPDQSRKQRTSHSSCGDLGSDNNTHVSEECAPWKENGTVAQSGLN